MSDSAPLDEFKRRIRVEQTVRDFLHLMDENGLDLEEGLVAWNMLGFTIFQDQYPEESHEQIQQRLIQFSQDLFYSQKPS